MKLTCDLCGGELEMNAAGQGVVCKNCGLTYSMERLKEKLAAQPTEKPAEEDVIYDAVEYAVIDGSAGGNSQKPPEEDVIYDAVDYAVIDGSAGGNDQKPPEVNTPPVTKSPTNTFAHKPSPAEAKKNKKRMWIMWVLLGLVICSAFFCALTLDYPVALLGIFFGNAFWIVIILLIFKPWNVYGRSKDHSKSDV